jgi:hypothetical protein
VKVQWIVLRARFHGGVGFLKDRKPKNKDRIGLGRVISIQVSTPAERGLNFSPFECSGSDVSKF